MERIAELIRSGERHSPRLGDVPHVMSESVDHIEVRTPASEFEHRMLHREGSTRWFVARGVVVERVDGARCA